MREDEPHHARAAEDVLHELETAPDRGLTEQEVKRRRDRYGPNRLRRAQRRSASKILLEQFRSIAILVLTAAAVLAFATQRWPEGIALVAVIAINAAIGFFSEWKAVRSMEALRAMGKRKTRVRRDGEEKEVGVESLVPEDIVLVEGGELVPADLRLVEAENLRVNEAALTGESVPANKRLNAVDPGAPLAERCDLLYKGTTVAEGDAEGVVVATGMETELGRISQMAEEAEGQTTPLQQRLDRLGRRLAWITIVVAVVVALAGLATSQEPTLIIETAIALGAAAIPEGLPIVATIALARGMWLMARRHALINKLTVVETLGATRVIFTEKTGTLTENRMTLRKVVTPSLTVAAKWLNFSETQAVTVSFLTLAFSKLWFVFNLRDRGASVLDNDVTRNPWIWGSFALCAALLAAAVYWPLLSDVLPTADPGWQGWLLVLGFSAIPALLGLVAPGISFYSAHAAGGPSTGERLEGRLAAIEQTVEKNRETLEELVAFERRQSHEGKNRAEASSDARGERDET